MAKPTVLICSPAFGGNFTHAYVLSIMATVPVLHAEGIKYGFLTIPTESLISRLRNRCAQVALAHKVDKLFFIDADVGWTPDQFLQIYYSKKALVGGTYPLKQIVPRLAYNPLVSHIEDIEKEKGLTEPRSIEELRLIKDYFSEDNGEVEVRHIPTGFMSIDVKLFEQLKPHVAHYEQADTVNPEIRTPHWEFFPAGARDGEFESEDWAFCRLVKEHTDEKVWLNSNIICTHTGVNTFRIAP